MSYAIQRLAKQALQTFLPSSYKDPQLFAESLAKLKAMVHEIRKSDVGLGAEVVTQSSKPWRRYTRDPPVSYVEIAENEVITMGIFILRAGARIPLHDHPHMYGIIKVLHGTVSIQNYSRADEKGNGDEDISQPFVVEKQPLLVVNTESEPCCLTPDAGNFHEIKAIEGPAAFLDILAPPYSYPVRKCNFFRELNATKTGERQCVPLCYLVEDNQPSDYWSDSKPYLGPKVSL